ncbi:MAG: methyltransferase domain-containing protein, partial [Polyangiaceae bacterium]|nr:methyltransferase domain-containing protein [Polyangiaceae bacterium]
MLRTIVQGTTEAFAAMLVCYLSGIAFGSLLAPRAARRTAPLRALGFFQLAAAALTFIGIAAAPQIVRLLVLVHGAPEVVPHDPGVLLFASALLLLPLGIALGTSVPLVFSSTSDDPRTAGAHAGRVLAASTLGGLAGALIAGFVIVPLPAIGGLERALYYVAVIHVVIATIALTATAGGSSLRRVASALGPAAFLTCAVAIGPSLELPFLLDAWFDPVDAAIAGPTDTDAPPLFLEEGRSTTVTILQRDRTLRLFNDGRPESGLTFEEPGFGPELVLLGGLPSLFAEQTDRALMIGLGGGHSTTMLHAGPFRRIDVVELEASVVTAARKLYQLRNAESATPLSFPLDDPSRVRYRIDDARAQLAFAEAGSYDAIVSQPSHPWFAGASALFTREFFLEVKRALREGGVLSQWINVFRMDATGLRSLLATLRSVFEHAVAFMAEDSSLVVLASDRPIVFDRRIEARFDASPELLRYFGPYRLDGTTALLSVLELDDAGLAAFARGGEILVDDRPTLEHRLSRIPHKQSMSYRDLDEA